MRKETIKELIASLLLLLGPLVMYLLYLKYGDVNKETWDIFKAWK